MTIDIRYHYAIPQPTFETAQALKQLVLEGHLTWAEAVKEFRAEFKVSLGYCINHGICRMMQEADKNYQS